MTKAGFIIIPHNNNNNLWIYKPIRPTLEVLISWKYIFKVGEELSRWVIRIITLTCTDLNFYVNIFRMGKTEVRKAPPLASEKTFGVLFFHDNSPRNSGIKPGKNTRISDTPRKCRSPTYSNIRPSNLSDLQIYKLWCRQMNTSFSVYVMNYEFNIDIVN